MEGGGSRMVARCGAEGVDVDSVAGDAAGCRVVGWEVWGVGCEVWGVGCEV